MSMACLSLRQCGCDGNYWKMLLLLLLLLKTSNGALLNGRIEPLMWDMLHDETVETMDRRNKKCE